MAVSSGSLSLGTGRGAIKTAGAQGRQSSGPATVSQGKRTRLGLSLHVDGDEADMRSSWHASPHSEARPPGFTVQVCHLYAV